MHGIGLRIVASTALFALLAACGQRGPLYLPKLPASGPNPASSPGGTQTAPVVAVPMQLPTPQTRLLDGTPSTIIAAPEVSMPEAGLSTMPYPTEPAPATTPSAGGLTTAPPPAATSQDGATPAQPTTQAQ